MIYPCAKDFDEKAIEKSSNQTTAQTGTRTPSNDNTTETVTVLGRQRNNPYTITNMTQAYNTIYETNLLALTATHKYVKFMPTTGDHHAELQDWELNTLTPIFDFPLEYEVTTIGDYYIDPTVQDSAYTYRYASVPVNVILPNVPNQILSELFVPPINSYLAEQVFYQVGENYEGDTSPHPEDPEGPGDGDDDNDDCHPGCDNWPCCKLAWNDCDEYPCGSDPINPPCQPESPNWPACLDIFPPPSGPGGDPLGDPNPDYCECTEYQQGQAIKTWKVQINPGEDCSKFEQNWGIGSGVECTPGVSLSPPPVVLNECGCPIPINPNIPAGCIEVNRDGSDVGVQQVMVKLKDTWFSGEITFTNNQGCWSLNESYSNNVRMWVQFENSNCEVRAIRKWCFWKASVVVDDYVDKFKHPPYNNINVHYSDGSNDIGGLARMYWGCAHTINVDNEYRAGAGADGIPIPRTGLNYLLNDNDGSAGGAPMLQGHLFGSWPQLLLYQNGIPSGALGTYLTVILLPDVTFGYGNSLATDPSGNIIKIPRTASIVRGILFHELGHASHHSLVGESYWIPYRDHIINNIILGSGVYGSFGNFANGSDPGRVAQGEALGNFTGNRYGGTSGGSESVSFNIPGDPSPENYIPRGLMFDLGDISPFEVITDPNPPLSPLKTGPDNISGFTPRMIYGALTPNVISLRSFRDKLGTLSLGSTPNTVSAYNTFVDIYDVFN